ncbi:DUF2142 domain-containing protein [Cellulomonas iranensis]|uniref:DUF2142 domain-containing protein n=1 Tax=Cellulomonas iranensis TaxID=76862 RepID=UPI0013D0038E|nr:DUF2142 domain-containing protein [Cellulomonas iranensis]
MTTTTTTPAVARWSTRRTFGWSFLALLVTFVAWAVANPMSAAPDEPAHATKAAAVVHGQLVGEVYDPEHPGWGHVDVPAVVAFSTSMPNCFAFKNDVTASCIPSLPTDPAPLTQAVTTASTYNPVYYAVVGLPSLLPTGEETLYLMRFVSAVLCALALAWAFTQALSSSRPDWTSLAVLVSMTPMVVYMSSAINPASLEIACATALWVSLPTLLRSTDDARLRSRLAAVCVIAAVFVNLRGLSPLFLAIIVAASVAVSPLPRTWDILRRRATWPWLALVAAAGVASLVWTRTAGTLESDGKVHHPTLDLWTAIQWSLGDTSVYVSNQMGQFGWVDTNLPTWVLMTIAVTAGLLVVLAVALGNRRERAVILALAVLVIVVPVLGHASQAKYLGIVWQGRYFLPASIGLPVLSGLVLARVAGARGLRFAWRTSVLLAGTWVVYQVIAFALNLHRYQNGASHGWRVGPPDQWHPPVPVPVLYLLLLAGLGTLVWLVLRATVRGPLVEALDGDPGADLELPPVPRDARSVPDGAATTAAR